MNLRGWIPGGGLLGCHSTPKSFRLSRLHWAYLIVCSLLFSFLASVVLSVLTSSLLVASFRMRPLCVRFFSLEIHFRSRDKRRDQGELLQKLCSLSFLAMIRSGSLIFELRELNNTPRKRTTRTKKVRSGRHLKRRMPKTRRLVKSAFVR
jgi:hypothetical protein